MQEKYVSPHLNLGLATPWFLSSLLTARVSKKKKNPKPFFNFIKMMSKRKSFG